MQTKSKFDINDRVYHKDTKDYNRMYGTVISVSKFTEAVRVKWDNKAEASHGTSTLVLDTEYSVEQISEMKCDYEYTISGTEAGSEETDGEVSEEDGYTLGVKIWEYSPNCWFISGYYDMPGCIQGLGDPVYVYAEDKTPSEFPPAVMKEVQSILFYGMDIFNDQRITMDEEDIKAVHELYVEFVPKPDLVLPPQTLTTMTFQVTAKEADYLYRSLMNLRTEIMTETIGNMTREMTEQERNAWKTFGEPVTTRQTPY